MPKIWHIHPQPTPEHPHDPPQHPPRRPPRRTHSPRRPARPNAPGSALELVHARRRGAAPGSGGARRRGGDPRAHGGLISLGGRGLRTHPGPRPCSVLGHGGERARGDERRAGRHRGRPLRVGPRVPLRRRVPECLPVGRQRPRVRGLQPPPAARDGRHHLSARHHRDTAAACAIFAWRQHAGPFGPPGARALQHAPPPRQDRAGRGDHVHHRRGRPGHPLLRYRHAPPHPTRGNGPRLAGRRGGRGPLLGVRAHRGLSGTPSAGAALEWAADRSAAPGLVRAGGLAPRQPLPRPDRARAPGARGRAR